MDLEEKLMSGAMWCAALAPGGCGPPVIVRAYLGQGLALVGAKTSLRVSQRNAVDHLGRRGNAKELMHPLVHLGMQRGNGATNPQGAGGQ